MQTPKGRSASSEVPQRVSPRAVRQLKTTALESESASSSNQASRMPKSRSPKVIERRSPRSPVPEKKRPSRISELESQVCHLQEELKKTKDQLTLSESWKKQAQQDAEESKKQLSALTSKLEDSEKKLLELSAWEEAHLAQLQKISLEKDEAWQSEIEAVKNSVDSSALASALNEIEQLKAHLETPPVLEAVHSNHTESGNTELHSLKEQLAETLSLVENMKTQLRNCKESEAQAQAQVSETMMQLETAKRTVDVLREEGLNVTEAYESAASELKQLRDQVSLQDGMLSTHDLGTVNSSDRDLYGVHGDDLKMEELEVAEDKKLGESNELQGELCSLKHEVGLLKCALEAAEVKYREEHIQSTVQIRNAYELVEQTKSRLSLREAELEAELEKRKADIEELKANLMDKETELQGIAEENEGLNSKLRRSSSCPEESKLEQELHKLREDVTDLRASLTAKETAMQKILDDNKMLRSEVKKREVGRGGDVDEDVTSELEAARAAEREAVMKLGIVIEEADESNRRAARVTEQLEATQAASCEMEAELRKLKVQTEQWRKAAEAAATMLSGGNGGKFMERNGSLDSNNYNPAELIPPYLEDTDDDMLKKKNSNMLKKIGVLWKKPHK